jgi:hypothetical protein
MHFDNNFTTLLQMHETYAKMIQTVYKNKCEISGWECIADSDTICIFKSKSTNKIVVAIRGMRIQNKEDILACASLINNTLTSTERFKKDKAFILSVSRSLTPNKLDYGLVLGHSLGGAIVDELLHQKIFSHGITFNPAVEPKYLSNEKNERYYNPEDFLYMLIGKYASNVHLTKPFHPPLEPGINLPYLFRLWTAHRIQQFVGEEQGSHLVQSVVLNKDKFDKDEAKAWIQNHGYRHSAIDETPNTYRFRQINPDIIKSGHYHPKMVKIGDKGHMLVLYK